MGILLNFFKRKKPIKKCEVLVELNNPIILSDEKIIRKAVRGKLKGKLALKGQFAISGNDPRTFVRRFVLTENSDFEPFSCAIKSFNGVVGVKKARD